MTVETEETSLHVWSYHSDRRERTAWFVRDRRNQAEPGSVGWLMGTLKAGRYTSVGSYPTYWRTQCGATLCYKCVRENAAQIGRSIRDNKICGLRDTDGYCVVAHDVNWEDASMHCDDCGQRIESAYAEDQADEPSEVEE